MSLLSIIQNAADRIGITRPSSVIASTDQQVRQLFGLAVEEGRSLSKLGDWEALTQEWTFITAAQAEQTNQPVPPDLESMLPDTAFNRTTQRKMIGPITPQQWQTIKAQPTVGLVYLSFRRRNGALLITPNPTAGEVIAYEYKSSYWARNSAGVAKATFTSDDDETYLDEELMVQGIRWRWKAAKGLDYGEDMRTYEINVQRALGEDGGSTALNIGSRPDPAAWRFNIPESFPVT